MSDQPSIVCPVCKMESFHPKDIEHGYCGYCHDFTSLGTISLPNKIGFTLPEPNHADFFRLNAVCRWNDEKDFEDTIIGVDMASLGYMANVRAGLIQQELNTEGLNEETLKSGMEISEEEAERERLVMCWIDAFTAGQKYAVMGVAKDNMEQEAKVDGNRRMRRRKK